MNSHHVILDISSDDEDDDRQESHYSPIDWLADLIGSVDGEFEEINDVVVVDEFSCASVAQKENCPTPITKNANSLNNSDDDCLILESDPDKLAAVTDHRAEASDDLLIIAEKGPVACRDFPHPRHLCVKFPFSITPHEKHCNLCHCYVCDKHAPCLYWGTGISPNDHCHSSDKEERWTAERKRLKSRNLASPALQKCPDTTLSITLPLHNSEQTLPFSQAPTLSSVMLQSSVSKMNQLHSLSPNSFRVPSVISCNRQNQRSRFIPSKMGVSQPSIRPLLMPRAHNIQRTGGNMGPPFVAHHSRFKRMGSSRSSPMVNQSGYSSTINPCPPTPLNGVNQDRWQDILAGVSSEMGAFQHWSSQPNNSNFADPPPLPCYSTSGFRSSPVSSQTQVYTLAQPVTEKNNQAPQPTPNPNTFMFENPSSWEPVPLDLSILNAHTASILPQPLIEDSRLPDVQPLDPPAVMITETTASSLAFHLENWSPEREPVADPTEDQLFSEPPYSPQSLPLASVLTYEFESMPANDLSEPDYLPLSPTHPSMLYNVEGTWGGLADV